MNPNAQQSVGTAIGSSGKDRNSTADDIERALGDAQSLASEVIMTVERICGPSAQDGSANVRPCRASGRLNSMADRADAARDAIQDAMDALNSLTRHFD